MACSSWARNGPSRVWATSASSSQRGVARDRIGEAVARLEPELRTVLVVTAVDGLSTKEAADLLGVPRGTVKTRLMRARQRVREDLS